MTGPESPAAAATRRAMRTWNPTELEQIRRLAEFEVSRAKRKAAESEQRIGFAEAMLALLARHGADPGSEVAVADLVRAGAVNRTDLRTTGLPDAEIDRVYAALGLAG